MPAHKTVIQKSHNAAKFLTPANSRYAREILEQTLFPFQNDLGLKGDITTDLLFSGNKKVSARLVAKSAGVLAGMQELDFFLQKDWAPKSFKFFGSIKLKALRKDGAAIGRGDTIAVLTGNFADILRVERTVLNLLQRMSGVATLAAEYVRMVPKNVLITPTRKTLWGLLDKRACAIGGAGTHRLNLEDAVLIKDTHLEAMRHDFEEIFRKLAKKKNPGRFVEIEVETLKNARTVIELFLKHQPLLPGNCLYLMLDNMKPGAITSFVKTLKTLKLQNKIILEASGGINLKNIRQYAKTGAEILSVGALTHSAPAMDISLKLDL